MDTWYIYHNTLFRQIEKKRNVTLLRILQNCMVKEFTINFVTTDQSANATQWFCQTRTAAYYKTGNLHEQLFWPVLRSVQQPQIKRQFKFNTKSCSQSAFSLYQPPREKLWSHLIGCWNTWHYTSWLLHEKLFCIPKRFAYLGYDSYTKRFHKAGWLSTHTVQACNIIQPEPDFSGSVLDFPRASHSCSNGQR